MTIIRGTCPVCHSSRPVKNDGTLRRHTQREAWPGVIVRRVCIGSGLPPLGSWPPHKPHTEAVR